MNEELNRSRNETSYPNTNYDSVSSENANQAWLEFIQRNKSFLTNVFYGQLCNEITCQNCHHVCFYDDQRTATRV